MTSRGHWGFMLKDSLYLKQLASPDWCFQISSEHQFGQSFLSHGLKYEQFLSFLIGNFLRSHKEDGSMSQHLNRSMPRIEIDWSTSILMIMALIQCEK